MNLSYWEENTFFSNIDFAIVGSGIVGLNCAIHLKQKFPKKKVVIFEKGLLPSGASTKNAEFTCFGSISEILDDLKIMSEDEVLHLIEKRWQGLQYLKTLHCNHPIDYQENGSYELFLENESKEFEACISKLENINKLLAPVISKKVFQEDNKSISKFRFNKVKHIIKNNFEGQIDTGKMMLQLLRLANTLGVIILNGMEIDNWTENYNTVDISVNHKAIKVNKLIFCTNGFAKTLLPKIDLNPARAQILITSPIQNLSIKGTFHYQKGYYYFRNIDNRILLGGGRNLDFEGETTTNLKTSTVIQKKLEHMLSEIILPKTNFTIEKRWAGIMGIGSKKTSIVKRISDKVSCAVRLGGMGVAIGSQIGKEVADASSK